MAPSAPQPSERSACGCCITSILGVVVGAGTGAVIAVWYAVAVIEPEVDRQVAMTGDDGGASGGFWLLAAMPFALLAGAVMGLIFAHILAHLIFTVRQRRRQP